MLWTIQGIMAGLSFVSTALVLGALMLSSQITRDEEETNFVHSRRGRIATQPTSRRIDTTPRQKAAL